MQFFISHKWRFPKLVWAFLIAEFPFTVAGLALFGIASPNLYRTQLWQEGGDLGFNSSPIDIVYAYANYRPVSIPLPWRQFTTNWNLVISTLTMFFLLTRVTMHAMHVLYPVISFIIHAVLVSLWAVAIRNQAGSDNADPDHHSSVPWYISKNCDVARSAKVKGYCKQAKASFAVSICMLCLLVAHIVVSVWSMFPTAAEKAKRKRKLEEKEVYNPDTEMTNEEYWEYQQRQTMELPNWPRTPGTARTMPLSPTTPRTRAFNTLQGTRGMSLPDRGQGQSSTQHGQRVAQVV